MANFVDKKILIIVFISFFVFSSCCVSNHPDSKSTSPIGEIFKDITKEPNRYISLDEAIGELNLTHKEHSSIHYIRGQNVDSSGWAQEWVIGVKQRPITNYFFIYSGLGGSVVPWKSWMPENEIDLNSILLPDDLFKIHSSELLSYYENDNFSHSNLEIIEKEYRVTFYLDESQVTFCFDSQTGTQKMC
ncbi:MAG: hypothetical protein A4E37_00213 [Methanoregulaceae archaeon PtaB.Bin056]|jgi:hypothetical protein|nr:MAG: hypothetical protein A4E37_00213 [Methanoregulaceae archaeon PtaB.Bin056]